MDKGPPQKPSPAGPSWSPRPAPLLADRAAFLGAVKADLSALPSFGRFPEGTSLCLFASLRISSPREAPFLLRRAAERLATAKRTVKEAVALRVVRGRNKFGPARLRRRVTAVLPPPHARSLLLQGVTGGDQDSEGIVHRSRMRSARCSSVGLMVMTRLIRWSRILPQDTEGTSVCWPPAAM